MPTPRGRTREGTILPKTTHPPQRRPPPSGRFDRSAGGQSSSSASPFRPSRFDDPSPNTAANPQDEKPPTDD